jgi:hypothetical protein
VYRIHALIDINGAAQYQEFSGAHNKTIASYRNIVLQREGRRKAEKAKQSEK